MTAASTTESGWSRPLLLWRWPTISPRVAWRLWKRNAILFRRSGAFHAVPGLVEPVFYLLAVGVGLGIYIGSRMSGIDYVLFVAPGLIAVAAMNAAVFETTFEVFTKLHFGRLYDAVVTTPLESEDIAVGELLWATTRALLAGTSFLVVTAALGYVVSPWALLAPLAIALVGIGFALIGLIVTSLLPSIDMYSYFFSLLITPMFLFSGVFFPVSDLPAAIRDVAWFTPLHHGVELLRALLVSGDVGVAADHALWLGVFTVVLVPPAVNLLRRRLVT